MDNHGTGNMGSPMSVQNDSMLGEFALLQHTPHTLSHVHTHTHTHTHCWSGSQEVMHMNAGQEPVDFESSNAIEGQLNLDAPDSSM